MEVPSIRQNAIVFWPKGFEESTAEEAFRGILDEMVGLGIVRRISETDCYTLRSPNVVSLLGTQQEIENELLQAETWEPPFQYQAETFRRALHQTDLANRSPLTAAQEGKLQMATGHVFLLTGCGMSGLQDVPAALHTLFGSDSFESVSQCRNLQELLNRIEKLRVRNAGRSQIIAVSVESGWMVQWIPEIAAKLLRLKSNSASVVFLANPLKVWELLEWDDTLVGKLNIVSLKPWDDPALRQWIDDCQFGPRDPDGRGQIRAITGNWPYLLKQLRRDPNKNWQEQLSVVAELVQTGESGLLNILKLFDLESAQLEIPRRVLRFVGEIGSPTSIDILSELVPEDSLNAPPSQLARAFRWAEYFSFGTREAEGLRADPIVSKALGVR